MRQLAAWVASIKLLSWRRWGIKGGLAIMDQGLFSGSSFVLNLLLARWLLPDEYGSFSVSFALFLFIAAFHIALLLEPASVIGPSQYGSELRAYLFNLYKIHFLLTLVPSVVLVIVGKSMVSSGGNSSMLGQALAGNGLSLSFVLLLGLVRRTFYIVQKPQYALIGSSAYAVLSIVGLTLIHSVGGANVFWAFVLTGGAGMISALMAFIAGRHLYGTAKGARLSWHTTLKELWQFGKWRTGAGILAITFGQLQTFFTAGMLGLDAAGTLRALQNFIQPIVQVETAIESLGLSSVSLEYSRGNVQEVKRKSFLISLSLFVLALLYMLILWGYARSLDQWIYSGKYSQHIDLVYWLALIPAFLALALGFAMPLLAIQKPQYYVVVYAINAPISLVTLPFLLKNYGMTGAISSLMIPAAINVVVSLALYLLWFPKRVDR